MIIHIQLPAVYLFTTIFTVVIRTLYKYSSLGFVIRNTVQWWKSQQQFTLMLKRTVQKTLRVTRFDSFIAQPEAMQDSRAGIFNDDLKVSSILSKVSHSGRVLICSLGPETLKILIFVRHRGTDPKGMEKTSYSMQRDGIDVSTHVCELQLLSVAEYKAYHSAVCLHRTLEPNYRAVWKSSACQQNRQGEKKYPHFCTFTEE